MAAAKSSKFHSISIHEDELCCPVCLDEMEDPKVLPQCAHKICKKCLENIATVTRGQYLECPLCRKRSLIPEGSVENFPTDHLVKLLIENIPGRQEKIALEQALKDCEDTMKERKAMLVSLDEVITTATQEGTFRANEVKREISEHARTLTALIQEQEKRLCSEVEAHKTTSSKVLELKRRKRALCEEIKRAEYCTSNVRDLLKQNCLEDIKDLKDVMVLQLKEHYEELVEPIGKKPQEYLDDTTIRFDRNMTLVSEQNLLGILNKVNKTAQGNAIQNIHSLKLDLKFETFSIAVLKNKYGQLNYVGVLRKNEQQFDVFDVFDVDGIHIKSMQLDAVPAQHLYDISGYSMRGIVFVYLLDYIDKQLLHYNQNGCCIKKTKFNENIKFISLDTYNRIILTSRKPVHDDPKVPMSLGMMIRASQPCSVLVYDPNKDKLQLKFGGQDLLNPSGRAVYHDKRFFVPDNYSNLKMFNDRGEFIQRLQLNGINPQDDNIFAVDVYNDSIIACSTNKKIVRVFSIRDFSLISTITVLDNPWMIEAMPRSSQGKRKMAVIYQDNTRMDIIGY